MSSAQIKAEEFATNVYRRLAKSMYDSYENGMSPDPAMMLNDFSGDDLSEEASEVFIILKFTAVTKKPSKNFYIQLNWRS